MKQDWRGPEQNVGSYCPKMNKGKGKRYCDSEIQGT